MSHLQGDPNGLQRVVTHRAHEAEEVEIRRAEMRTHLATGGMGIRGAQRTVEEHFRRDPAGQHQCLVAIMKVEPILRPQMSCENGARLMAGATNVEEGLAAIDQFHFHLVHSPGGKHGLIQTLDHCRPIGPKRTETADARTDAHASDGIHGSHPAPKEGSTKDQKRRNTTRTGRNLLSKAFKNQHVEQHTQQQHEK